MAREDKSRVFEEKIRKSVGYYDWQDVVQCACSIVRRLGVSGSRDFLDRIQDIVGLIANIREGIGTVTGLVGKLQALGESLFGLDFVRQKVMGMIAGNVNVCPVVDAALRRELASIGYGVDLSIFDWFKSRVDFISKYGNRAQRELRELEDFLNMLIELVMLVEDCAVELSGRDRKSGRSLKNVLSGELRRSEQVVEAEVKELNLIYRVSSCNVRGDVWIAYERDGYIYVRRMADMDNEIKVTAGWYPRLFYDGVYVYLIFSGSNRKGRMLRFLPDELGYFGIGVNLWDCLGMKGSVVERLERARFRGCVGEFGIVDRVVWWGSERGDMVVVSWPDNFRGAVPVVSGLYWSDAYNKLNWNDVVVDGSVWERKFRVYEEGVLFGETVNNWYYSEEFSGGVDYWVIVVVRNRVTGEEWEGCGSEKMRFTAPKIGKKEFVGAGEGLLYEVEKIMDYNVNVLTGGVEQYEGMEGLVAGMEKIVDYNVNVLTGGVEQYEGMEGVVNDMMEMVNFFPAELM